MNANKGLLPEGSGLSLYLHRKRGLLPSGGEINKQRDKERCIYTHKRTYAEQNSRGGEIVSERKYKRAEEWTDDIPDPEEEAPEDNEQVYRDGSSKNECWNEEQR